MWCPKCKSEYRDGFTVCSECGSALMQELPKEPEFEPVFLTRTEAESPWELPELLRRAGIACYLQGGEGMFIRIEPEQEIPGYIYVNRRDLPVAKRCVMMLSRPPVPMEEGDLMEAYDEYMSTAGEPEEVPEEDSETGGTVWKVFLTLAFVVIGCVLAAIFLT